MARNSKYLKKRRKTGKIRHFFRFIRAVLYITLIFLSIISLQKFLETSPFFNIKDIKITGCTHYPDEVIIETFELDKNSNIFSIDLDRVREKILKLSWINDVKIKKNLSRIIDIEIIERVSEAVIKKEDLYFFIDRDCYVLDKKNKYIEKTLPIIKNLKFEEINIGDKLDIDGLIEVIVIFNNLSEDMKKTISYYSISDGLNISAFTNDNIEIIFGNSENLAKKEEAVLEIYKLYESIAEQRESTKEENENVESENSKDKNNQLKIIDVRVWTKPVTTP